LSPAREKRCPLLVILSGPSGVGKDAVLSRMRELRRPYHFVVTATTRPRRSTERDGVNYIFLDQATFQRMIEDHEMLEWAQVYGNYYGVPKGQVTKALAEGKDVLIKTDVQGAATIKRLAPEAVSIFLRPFEMHELTTRLAARHTESPETLALRLKTAEAEMLEAPKFDHVITNRQGRLDDAVRSVEEAVAKERLRVPQRCVRL
jgi:guanylate kinase